MTKLIALLRGACKSWTVWFNGVAGLAVAALPDLQASFPQLQDYLPSNVYHQAMGFLVVMNILLRFKTNKALSDK